MTYWSLLFVLLTWMSPVEAKSVTSEISVHFEFNFFGLFKWGASGKTTEVQEVPDTQAEDQSQSSESSTVDEDEVVSEDHAGNDDSGECPAE